MRNWNVAFIAASIGILAAAPSCVGDAPHQPAATTARAVQTAPTVHLLIEGYVQAIPGRQLVPGVDPNGGRLVASTMGVVVGPDATVFVDPGFIADRSRIVDGLADIGVDPDDVTHVFISHHHPDHTVNAALFPNAALVDFWATYRGDLWEDHGDNHDIAPGVSVVRTPGHTDEDASLAVDTAAGTVVFTHVWWNEALFPPIDPIADDQAALDTSRQIVLNLADCIIPGHGTAFANPNKPQVGCGMVYMPDDQSESDSDSESESDSNSDSDD